MGNKQEDAKFLSITQAAHDLGLTRQGLWWLIKDGIIKATKIGATYAVTRTEVRRFRKQRIAEVERELEALKILDKAGN